MKLAYLFISILQIIIATSTRVSAQEVCIEVKDREHLPNEIYENLKDYKAILIGEMHGTNESPQYVEGMVNLWLDAGRKVILGIEIYGIEQDKIDSFLSTGDFSIIQKMPYFNLRIQYGVSSKAMANLIKSCYGKPNLKIVCLDITDYRRTHNKDSMLAVCINNTLKSNPGCTMITLTGNIHNKLDSTHFGKTMGYLLYTMPNCILSRKGIASFDVVFDSGTAWCCQPDCGIHHESSYSTWKTDNCKYDNFFRMDENGNMVLYTRKITASLPLNP